MLILIIGLIVAVVWGISYFNNQQNLKNSVVLEVNFSENIPEKSINLSLFESVALGEESQVSMRELMELLDYAATDPKVKAISVDGSSVIRHTKSMEVSRLLSKFQESGKKVYGYGDFYSQGAYAMSCTADSLFMNPMGYTDLKGYALIMTYFKDFFEKYGIKMEVFVAGKYKSSVESYTRNNASELNKDQYSIYLNNLFIELSDHISSNRNINSENVRNIINQALSYNSKKSLEYNLIDQLLHRTDYLTFLEKRTGVKESDIIGLSRYKQYVQFKTKKIKKHNTAFVVIDGEISSTSGVSSSKNLRKSFQDIRKNDDIDVIVLRINSPGGSAFASEEIWHEIELCKAANKSVYASVSSVSASGGYYLMCSSDKIFAPPSSVTGSIGVYIAFPEFSKAIEKNFSIHTDHIETGPFALRNTGIASLNDQQKTMYKNVTNELYDRFLNRVSEGRNMDLEQTEEIAQGRIYTGNDALKNGLVDSLIYLDQVLEFIKEEKNLASISIKEYPQTSQSFIPELENVKLMSFSVKNNFEKMVSKQQAQLEGYLTKIEPIMRLPFFEISH